MECSSVSDWLLINNVTDLGIFLWIGWNSTKFDLLIFKDSLFAHNQEWTLLSSLLRLLSSMLIFYAWEINWYRQQTDGSVVALSSYGNR